MKTAIKCNCGQRIILKDVMQTGYYLRLVGPNLIYVKYRCSRCKRLGEQFVKQAEWEDGILTEVLSEPSAEELTLFGDMGPISIHECIDAHFDLERLDNLNALLETAQESKAG